MSSPPYLPIRHIPLIPQRLSTPLIGIALLRTERTRSLLQHSGHLTRKRLAVKRKNNKIKEAMLAVHGMLHIVCRHASCQCSLCVRRWVMRFVFLYACMFKSPINIWRQ